MKTHYISNAVVVYPRHLRIDKGEKKTAQVESNGRQQADKKAERITVGETRGGNTRITVRFSEFF
jgi:hypothetical protein